MHSTAYGTQVFWHYHNGNKYKISGEKSMPLSAWSEAEYKYPAQPLVFGTGDRLARCLVWYSIV